MVLKSTTRYDAISKRGGNLGHTQLQKYAQNDINKRLTTCRAPHAPRLNVTLTEQCLTGER
jgi:hypothetical protein